MKYIYADNAATTRMSERAMQVMIEHLKETYGNPSSLHSEGQKAAMALMEARKKIAASIGARADEIYFTSGGSEADNQAILTAAAYGARKGKKHLISTTIEHHAVLHTLKRMEQQGYEVTLLAPDADGMIDAEAVKAAIRPDTALVTVMFANNEIGTIQPVEEIGAICKERGVIFHTDAVQAAGHVEIDVVRQKIDMLSLAGHKFHGPKGVGALYARRGIPVASLIEGGAQERGKRGGTENIPAIAAMAAALEEACGQLAETQEYVMSLRDRLIKGLEQIPHAKLNGHPTKRLPGNVNFVFEGIEGESMLLLLDDKGIAASSGSACTSGSLDPSHVLLAVGLPHEVAHGSLRLTLSAENSREEVDYIIQTVPEIVRYLRNMSPVWEALEKGEREYVIQ